MRLVAVLLFGLMPVGAMACTGPAQEWPVEGNDTFRAVPGCEEGAWTCDRDGVRAAWFGDPTARYAHGVLGDAIEYGRLSVHTDSPGADSCHHKSITLDDAHVFEDVEPRLADLDGDGRIEVIVVRTHKDLGAQLAIYRDRKGRRGLELWAATPFIGRSNRWLAPVGAADLDGDGAVEIAYVDRPHLAKTIRIWQFKNGRLTQEGDLPGFTNHRIGEDTIAGGIRQCAGETPEMIVADAGWQAIFAVAWNGSGFSTREIGPHRGRDSIAAALLCR